MKAIYSVLFSFYLFSILLVTCDTVNGEEYKLNSPENKTGITISVTDIVTWSVALNEIELLKPSKISLKLSNGNELGVKPQVKDVKKNSVDETIESPVPVKNKFIRNHFNELKINFSGNYSLTFRAYDDGAAYRFETNLDEKEIAVTAETAEFNFTGNYRTFFPEEEAKDFISHYERNYKDTLIAGISPDQYCSLPALFEVEKGIKLLITEADLFDYPNMFLAGTGSNAVNAIFPNVILETKYVNDRNEKIVKNADYLAKTSGTRTFPWRTILIAEKDKDLLENEMVFKLSSPTVIKNTAWIKPGKVAWDWWNNWNIYGVDFASGINTKTYKYYIDFASIYGLDYIILDEGWSLTSHNLMHTIPDIDLKEIIDYGKQKNVGVILWVLWNALDKDMPGILDQFVKWGAKGIKVDFMQRGDQFMVNFYERCAIEAAKRNLLVDFHGAYKPSGLTRKYPNVLSHEGVRGLENSKWSTLVTPGHDVTLPFTRMVAGPMDFTPGAMINANKDNFRIVFTEPMSQGTRCHQAAMYVVYESPLQMFADNPSNYLKEPEYTKFVAQFPTIWDKTIGLDSKVGEYVAIARKKDNKWYIGAMTNWDKREMEIPLSFLEPGNYILENVEDGINAEKHAADYKLVKKEIKSTDVLKIKLAPGGGWAGIITPAK